MLFVIFENEPALLKKSNRNHNIFLNLLTPLSYFSYSEKKCHREQVGLLSRGEIESCLRSWQQRQIGVKRKKNFHCQKPLKNKKNYVICSHK